MAPPDFITALTDLFKNNAHQETSIQQAAYMKNNFLFFGLPKKKRALLESKLVKELTINTETELIEIINLLWQQSQREFQYTALHLMLKKPHQKIMTTDFIHIAAKLIRTKSWWDTVDPLSSNVVGSLVAKFPQLIKKIDTWIDDENFWIRRAALIHQLTFKEKTDFKRLFLYCKKTLTEKEFFIRKAIGWALRQYSKTNPQPIREFIKTHKSEFSGLSLREATKYL